ncbi:hypothetical protein A6M21_15210 [Desulfotomaculum copahuensis]|uniref:Anti-sigma-W factor RsiW n=2 Tax=Desulfotomaculum copahuensis TaxID=1838280 RepID=A0A1B7LBE7_9FIRM|nr:hypothetical protein A6M21_15210 [Desulfotomaculum copahuensis]
MQCREARKLIYPCLDGELPGDAERAFREHLAVCPGCRAEMAQCRAIAGALKGMAVPVVPPQGFSAGVMERLAGEGTGLLPDAGRLAGTGKGAHAGAALPAGNGPGRWWGNLSAAWRRGVAVAASALILLGGTAGFAARYGWLPVSMHAPAVIADNNSGSGQTAPGHSGGQTVAPVPGNANPAAPGQPGVTQPNGASKEGTGQPGNSADRQTGNNTGANGGSQTGAARNSGTPADKSSPSKMSSLSAPGAPRVFLNQPRTIDSMLIKVQVTDLAAARQKLLAATGGASYQGFGQQYEAGHKVEIMRFVVPAERANTFENTARSLGMVIDEQQQSKDISAQFAATLDHYQALIAQRNSGGGTADLNAQIKSLEQQLVTWDQEAQDQVVVVWVQQ